MVLDAAGRVHYRGGIDSDKTHLHDDSDAYLKDALDALLADREPAVTEGRDARLRAKEMVTIMHRSFAYRLLWAHALAAAALGVVLAACSGGSSGTSPGGFSCPNVSDLTCPSPPPSFKTDVQPIIETRCYPCHGPGGIEVGTINLTSYHGVVSNDVVGIVGQCMMPPPDAGQLTMAERDTLFEWIACSEPNN